MTTPPRSGRVRLGVHVANNMLVVDAWADEPNPVQTRLEVETDRVNQSHAGPICYRTIRRVVTDRRTGQTLENRLIARGQTRVLDATQQRRNCLTCEEADCHARVAVG